MVNRSPTVKMNISYRCYLGQRNPAGWRMRLLFPLIDEAWPVRFVWTVRSDFDGLHRYIDAVLAGKASEAKWFEDKGLVKDVEFVDMDHREVSRDCARFNFTRFLDLCMMRDKFKIPLWGKVRFVTNGHNFVPTEFIAPLFQAAGEELPPGEWKLATTDDLEAAGLKPEDIHSGMNYVEPTSSPAATAAAASVGLTAGNVAEDADPELPPAEVELARERYPRHFELVTEVRASTGTYYCRRLIDYEGRMLWAGTSWQRGGPWRVYERDQSRLMALGITP